MLDWPANQEPAGSCESTTRPVDSYAANAAFDAVTAELQVNADSKAPLLCVSAVHKVASGDLSFPGVITETK